jgi:hypothetical protein
VTVSDKGTGQGSVISPLLAPANALHSLGLPALRLRSLGQQLAKARGHRRIVRLSLGPCVL